VKGLMGHKTVWGRHTSFCALRKALCQQTTVIPTKCSAVMSFSALTSLSFPIIYPIYSFDFAGKMGLFRNTALVSVSIEAHIV